MLAQGTNVCVVGYDLRYNKPFQLFNGQLNIDKSEQVLLVTPICDTIHNYILSISLKNKSQTVMRIFQIKPTHDDPFSQNRGSTSDKVR
jgi:hypothetical protein